MRKAYSQLSFAKRHAAGAVLFLLLSFALLASVTFAWYGNVVRTPIGGVSGHIIYLARYFESGNGQAPAKITSGYDANGDWIASLKDPSDPSSAYTESEFESPDTNAAFEIKTPTQLYNLAWLQYLGYFAENADPNNTSEGPVYYFYLSSDLDMTGYVLPPIGSTTYPFIGSFDGNGHTISNLKVSNDPAEFKEPNSETSFSEAPKVIKDELLYGDAEQQKLKNVEVVGLFGVVGEREGSQTYNITSAGIASVSNVIIDGIDVVTHDQENGTLAGLAAGYVNAPVSNVKVIGGTITSEGSASAFASALTDNLSDFTAVGYCTDPYKTKNEISTFRIYDPQVMSTGGSGSQSGGTGNWGGSVDMMAMYNDLNGIYQNEGDSSVEYDSQVRIYHALDGSVTETVTATAAATLYDGAYPVRMSEKTSGGAVVASYSLIEQDGTQNFVYLDGAKLAATVTTDVTDVYEIQTVYIYSGTDDYLMMTSDGFENTTNSALATKWIIDASNHIYTIDSWGDTYYLTKNFSNGLSRSGPENAVVWEIGTNTIQNNGYYLCYYDGVWQLKARSVNYITDHNSVNYLSVSGGAIVNTTQLGASSWVKGPSGSGFTLSVIEGGVTYYLMGDGEKNLTLAAAPDAPTVWYEADLNTENPKLYYKISESNGYALYYDSTAGNWNLTEYVLNSQGNDWGGSIDMYSLNQRLYHLLSGPDATIHSTGSYKRFMSYSDIYESVSVYRENANTYYLKNPAQEQVFYALLGKGLHTKRISAKNYTVDFPGSVLPLLVNDEASDNSHSYSTSDKNTGYIIGGSMNGDPGTSTIRSSTYQMRFISNSLNDANNSNVQVRTGSGGTYPDYSASYVEILTNKQVAYNQNGTGSSNYVLIKDELSGKNANHNPSASSAVAGYTKSDATTPTELGLTKYNEAREALDSIMTGEDFIHGLHFYYASGVTVSANNTVTIDNAIINGSDPMDDYELPVNTIDFNLKSAGKINFFAGSYYNQTTTSLGSYADSFFSIYEVTRSGSDITAVTRIDYVYKNNDYNSADPSSKPYVYQYQNGSKPSNAGEMVFDMNYMYNTPPVANALYYFEISVNSGEYAMSCVSGKEAGSYLMYLDISANATIEGDARLLATVYEGLYAKREDGGYITEEFSSTRDVELNTLPTYFPLAWEEDGEGARTGAVASNNTGYVISGANTASTPPGDIRVSQYIKYANGNWASIRNSLTAANNNGILNNARVYTIVGGRQQSIAAYGIGNQYTLNYQRTAAEVNDLLRGQQYVYGLHFMQSSISAGNTVTVPSAVINGTEYTDYVMPQDSVDFNVQARGRITFYAGTYFSGSGGTQSFFSLHHIIRSGQDIQAIYELSGIYGNGSSDQYIYTYNDAEHTGYYWSDGTEVEGGALPEGYSLLFDTAVISDPNSVTGAGSLTQNSVYYFEIPVDAGEFALGSSDSDGAYLIYLDIAANAQFDVKTVITEATETEVRSLEYPNGVAFTDSASSNRFSDANGSADPAKSVFLSLPISNSSGTTSISMSAAGALTVTNGESSLAGWTAASIPEGTSLSVNGSAAVVLTGKYIWTETVTEINSDPNGTTIITVTETTQITDGSVPSSATIASGKTVTTVTETVSTYMGGVLTGEPVVTDKSAGFDGRVLGAPADYTGTVETDAGVIFEFTLDPGGYTGFTITAVREGDLYFEEVITNGSPVTHTQTETVNGVETELVYTIMDVLAYTQTSDSGDAPVSMPGGVYYVTIARSGEGSAQAGTYTVRVTVMDGEFNFYLNEVLLDDTAPFPELAAVQ